MAYSEKYHHIYCDREGNEYRISLRELDYEGSSTLVEGRDIPWIVEQENSSNLKVGGVYPTKATAVFISEGSFTLEELYTGDEATYQLARLKNGVVDWIGYVIPDGFSEDNWDGNKQLLSVQASDNLPSLKGLPFVDEFGENFGNSDTYIRSFLWVIKEAIKKTGSLLPIWTMVDLKTLVTASEFKYEVRISGDSDGFFLFEVGEDISVANDIISKLNESGKVILDSPSATGTFTVVSSALETHLPGDPYEIKVSVSETVSNFSYENGDIEIIQPENGLVLARRGHFNDVAASEIGIYKEGVDFSFLKVGDTLKISDSTNNDGTYEVTGFVNSVPPDSPYIRIQLSPQVPEQIHENVIVEIISVNADYPDPLLTEHDVRVWIRDSNVEGKTYYEARGGAMMTWDVLDAIARQFNVKIQQNQGHWEVKRWNADKKESGVYQWYIYNSEGTPIGRHPFGDDLYMPCVAEVNKYRIYGTSRQMDRVLKNVIVNYRYKYKQDGDSLNNIVVNGNFEGALNPYPRGWDKIDSVSVGGIPQMVMTKENTGLPAGFSDALRIANYTNNRTLTNLTVLSSAEVNKGDRLKIQWYERIDDPDDNRSSVGIYAISIFESIDHAMGRPVRGVRSSQSYDYKTQAYDLVNDGEDNGRQAIGTVKVDNILGRWRDQREDGDALKHFRLTSTPDRSGDWRKIEIEVGEVPINGYIKLEVIGSAKNVYDNPINDLRTGGILASSVFAPDRNVPRGTTERQYVSQRRSYYNQSDNVSIVVTGFYIGKIVDPDNEVVPQIDPFMYPDYQAQLSRKYTDTISEIEVLTGDDYGAYSEDRISGMMWNGEQTSMWDSWDNRYGWSRQGLVTAKSVIEMYWKPTRLLDVDISAPGIHWSSRFEFEEMPGLRFVILRGNISSYHDNFKGTLTEIHDQSAAPLPPGGNDGGNTVKPNWQSTGVSRCVRGDDGLNTGLVETVETDINPASPTYGQERWVNSGTNTGQCPIGEPIDLFWGASTLPIDPATLEYFPYQKDGNDYVVRFDNDGTGKYLVFLHRASIGTVTSIRYLNGGWQAYGNLPSWQYEADTTINGYTYKVMRQIYMSGVLNQLPLIFTIQ